MSTTVTITSKPVDHGKLAVGLENVFVLSVNLSPLPSFVKNTTTGIQDEALKVVGGCVVNMSDAKEKARKEMELAAQKARAEARKYLEVSELKVCVASLIVHAILHFLKTVYAPTIFYFFQEPPFIAHMFDTPIRPTAVDLQKASV